METDRIRKRKKNCVKREGNKWQVKCNEVAIGLIFSVEKKHHKEQENELL